MRGDDREIILLEEDSPSALKWLVIGAALGAGLALLLAPAAGHETRDRLTRKAMRLRDAAEEAIDELQERFDAFRESGGGEGDPEGGGEEVEDGDSEAEGGDAEAEAGEEPEAGSVSAARRELERRLAAVRARRRAPVPEDDEEPVA